VPPTYDIGQSYEFNYERGPLLEGPFAEVPSTPLKELFGLKVRSRIGIAAGLLLNSKWIAGYARLGFDLLTYKTVRSQSRACYPPPNWVFVEAPNDSGPVYETNFDPQHAADASSAVCFGMPSMSPDVWRRDIRIAKSSLGEGQVLIVSVVATPGENPSAQGIAEDFAQCAAWATEAGADVIEANFSCPNVCSAEGSIFLDAKFSGLIAGQIRRAIGSTPLTIKIGEFGSPAKMRTFFHAVANSANAVTLVNCIVRPVLNRAGQPVFGEQFRNVGVTGRAIHRPSLALIRQAAELMKQDGLDLKILAVGGASRAADVGDFFTAGAAAVLMGSAPMYLPDLALKIKRRHSDW